MFRVYRALCLFILSILHSSQADKRTSSLVYLTEGAQEAQEAQERASDGEGHILAVDRYTHSLTHSHSLSHTHTHTHTYTHTTAIISSFGEPHLYYPYQE
jgi:hypothetical protein